MAPRKEHRDDDARPGQSPAVRHTGDGARLVPPGRSDHADDRAGTDGSAVLRPPMRAELRDAVARAAPPGGADPAAHDREPAGDGAALRAGPQPADRDDRGRPHAARLPNTAGAARPRVDARGADQRDDPDGRGVAGAPATPRAADADARPGARPPRGGAAMARGAQADRVPAHTVAGEAGPGLCVRAAPPSRPASVARGRVQLELPDEPPPVNPALGCRAADLAARLCGRARELGAETLARRFAGIVASAERSARAYLRDPRGTAGWDGPGIGGAAAARADAPQQSGPAARRDGGLDVFFAARRSRAAARAAAADRRRLTSWTQHEQSFPPDGPPADGEVDQSLERDAALQRASTSGGRRVRAMRDRLREVHREIAPVVLNAKGKDVFARHRKCGVCRRETAGVELKLGRTGVASFVGLVLSGSVWACPPCSYVICRKRAEELRTVLTRHAAIGGGDCMLTLTTPHDLGDALKPMRQQTARAWRFVCSGNPWKRVRARYGIQFVRGAEVTHGANGWHPHLHVVLLTRRPLSDAQQRELEGFFWRRWSRAITKPHKETGTQYRVPLEGVGFFVR